MAVVKIKQNFREGKGISLISGPFTAGFNWIDPVSSSFHCPTSRVSTRKWNINIIEQIGSHYRMLGPLLLNDDTGIITDDIAKKFSKNAFDINFEILKRWIRGMNITPVTWETLVAKLKSIRLTELTRKIYIDYASLLFLLKFIVSSSVLFASLKHSTSIKYVAQCFHCSEFSVYV